ncbi:hypothetical protein ABK040_006229 [Willaertia magna]
MVSHNNAVPQSKWKKDWTDRVKLFFNQPAKAKKRAETRLAKALKVFPRPTESLRPVVRLNSKRYNRKSALGRGFSIEELKQAGIPVQFARTVGISVDLRRRNLSEERLQENVQRLKEYKERLVLFPRTKGKFKKGPIADTQEKVDVTSQVKGTVLPIKVAAPTVEVREITKEQQEFSAYKAVKKARKAIKQYRYLQSKKAKAKKGGAAPQGQSQQE